MRGVVFPGDRIVSYLDVPDRHGSCTTCDHCRSGWQQLCQVAKPMVRVYGNNDDGGHAPYLKVPANTLIPLPEELSFAAGAAISCGTGTAYNALVRLNLSARHTIAIFGQGPVGLSATQLAHAMNARVIAVDFNAERLQRVGLQTISLIKLFLAVSFTYVFYAGARVSRGESAGVGVWFTPVFVLAVALMVGGSVVRMLRAR